MRDASNVNGMRQTASNGWPMRILPGLIGTRPLWIALVVHHCSGLLVSGRIRLSTFFCKQYRNAEESIDDYRDCNDAMYCL